MICETCGKKILKDEKKPLKAQIFKFIQKEGLEKDFVPLEEIITRFDVEYFQEQIINELENLKKHGEIYYPKYGFVKVT